MAKVKIDFINTCPCCDAYGKTLQEIAAAHPDNIDLTLYTAGKDMGYVPKYGAVTRGTMIVNEKDRYEEGYLNKRIIGEIVDKALAEAESEG